jgi:predicted metal-dependent phosphotriesterase family hydrolase
MQHPLLTRRVLLGVLGAGGLSFAAKTAFPKGAVIRTVLEDVPPEKLASGATLFHEHLSLDLHFPGQAAPKGPPLTADLDLMTKELQAARKDGIQCIVDGGHADMGRSVDALKTLAQRTGLYIVASGGYYMGIFYPPELTSKSEDEIADTLVREARENRYGAFGEIGENSNAAMSSDERKIFRAVGKAHVRTNLPIFTHNAYGTGPNVPRDAGLRQLDVFESVGVKPQHVAIGHTCCLDDPKAEIIKQIAKRGAFVGFDRMTTLERLLTDEKRAKMAAEFIHAGYADHLLLSSDYSGSRNPDDPSWGRSKTQFAPRLLQLGVKEETLHQIFYDNPRRFLAFVPKK